MMSLTTGTNDHLYDDVVGVVVPLVHRVALPVLHVDGSDATHQKL